MEELPHWTSLLVNRDVIPYDDLKISPGYGRKLLLPDDIPPVLALPWALGPKVPRANRCQDDGSLNVFVVNQGGGGGGNPTPIEYAHTIVPQPIAQFGSTYVDIILPQVITLIHVSWKFTTATLNNVSPVALHMTCQGSEPNITLCSFFADSIDSTGIHAYVTDIVIPFNPPWQIRENNIFANTLYTLDCAGGTGDGSLVLDVWGYNLP